MKKNIVLLDLFSGIGGFALGLEQAGFRIKKHFYSEIDKHAIANYRYNFKNATYAGNVTTLDGRSINHPHIITFGSPCQDFSVAGKRAGMGGERSSLIGEAIRLIAECRPDVFIWENVKGVFSSNSGADFWGVVQAFANIGGYRLEWQLLNTSWVLPQNRERIYLIGHLAKAGRDSRGVFPFTDSDEKSRIRNGQTQSSVIIDSNYLSRDCRIYEGNAPTLNSRDYKDPKIVTSRGRGENWEQQLEQRNDGVTNTLTGVQKDNMILTHYGHKDKDATEHEIVPTLKAESHGHEPMVKVPSATKQGFEVAQEGDSINLQHLKSKTRRGRVGKGVAQTLDTQQHQAVVLPEFITDGIGDDGFEIGYYAVPLRWQRSEKGKKNRRKNQKKGKDYTPFSDGNRELKPTDDPNSGCITGALNKDVLIGVGTLRTHKDGQGFRKTQSGLSPTIPARAREDGSLSRDYSEQDRVYDAELSTQAATVAATSNSKYLHNSLIRRLTEIECERLQGFPDNWTEYGDYDGVVKKMAKTQRYKCLGNAVTVAVVKEIGQRLLKLS